MSDKTAQTRRKCAREQRSMKVDVAGEKYLTVICVNGVAFQLRSRATRAWDNTMRRYGGEKRKPYLLSYRLRLQLHNLRTAGQFALGLPAGGAALLLRLG